MIKVFENINFENIYIVIILGGLGGSALATIYLGLPYIAITIEFSVFCLIYGFYHVCDRICDAMFDATNIRRRCRVCEDTAIKDHNDFVASIKEHNKKQHKDKAEK